MDIRKITPHKGGRTERAYIRCTPETKAALERLKAIHDLTAADLLEWAVNNFPSKTDKGL